MIFGKRDNHVPPEGRDLIRKTLHEAGVTFSFYEVAWAQRKLPSQISVDFYVHVRIEDGMGGVALQDELS